MTPLHLAAPAGLRGETEKTRPRSFTMVLTVLFNAILALGVIVMVVTPLVWAILTQHRDHPQPEATDTAKIDTRQSRERRHAARPQYDSILGRI
jgi:hypothetical protein